MDSSSDEGGEHREFGGECVGVSVRTQPEGRSTSRGNQRDVTLGVTELVKWSLEGCYPRVASGCSVQSVGLAVRDGR